MEKIDIAKATEYTSPNPVTVVCTLKEDGTPNLAPVSWFTYLSFNPPMIGFAMGKPSCTGKMVRETGEAVITVPSTGMAGKVMKCGMSSGNDTDKSDIMELTDIPGTEVRIPEGCKLAMHVRLNRCEDVGDHYLYICDVDDVYGDENRDALFAWKGYTALAAAEQK